jgi:Calcineurin-like phosphoesterase
MASANAAFEHAIRQSLNVEVAHAGLAPEMSPPEPTRRDLKRLNSTLPSKAKATLLLREAFKRLDDSPGLRRLAPDGRVAYSDPVLTAAAEYGEAAANIGLASASVEGAELKNSTIWRWAIVGVEAWLNKGDKGMSDLAARVPTKPIELEGSPTRIAVVGDAGYRGVVQDAVIDMIANVHSKKPFDFLVHLGDVYFSAGAQAMLIHLLAPFNRLGIPWATLCGNHDLYHGPEAYMSALDVLGQPGRYFLIKTDEWQIAALDTSFAAKDFRRGNGELDRGQLNWLKSVIGSAGARRTVLMSHHFIVSGWDEPSKPLERQLGKLARNKVFAWYWGHEHRCALYDRGSWGFYGASVGNGAFLEQFSAATRHQHAAVWHGNNLRCDCAGITQNTYWPHGFAELEFGSNALVETMHLEDNVSKQRVLAIPEVQSQ